MARPSSSKSYATFLLGDQLEIGIEVNKVQEATRVVEPFVPMPSTVSFFKGFLRLREQLIPIIDLNKRLNQDQNESSKGTLVVVVEHHNRVYGILIQKVQDVLAIDSCDIIPHDAHIQGDEKVILGVAALDAGQRVIHLLELGQVFSEYPDASLQSEAQQLLQKEKTVSRSRYAVFCSGRHEYGIRIEHVRSLQKKQTLEQCPLDSCIAGLATIHNRTIAVFDFRTLVADIGEPAVENSADTRILVLENQGLVFGIIIDAIREIRTVPEDTIMPLPFSQDGAITGIIRAKEQTRVILLDAEHFFERIMDDVRAADLLEEDRNVATELVEDRLSGNSHCITENSYLVVRAHIDLALQLSQVQEILPPRDIIQLPDLADFHRGVIDLRGSIIPVLDTRHFLRQPKSPDPHAYMLVVAGIDQHRVALLVDSITTIVNEEKSFATPVLNEQLRPRQNVLSRLIPFSPDKTDLTTLVMDTAVVVDLLRTTGEVMDEPKENKPCEQPTTPGGQAADTGADC